MRDEKKIFQFMKNNILKEDAFFAVVLSRRAIKTPFMHLGRDYTIAYKKLLRGVHLLEDRRILIAVKRSNLSVTQEDKLFLKKIIPMLLGGGVLFSGFIVFDSENYFYENF